MLDRIRSKLNYANVIATLALFVALGGGAYAAATVNSADIQNNSVKSKDVKNNNIKGIDVKEKSLAAVCPSGAPSLAPGSVCYGGQQAATDWDLAARDCASEDLRLPDLGEGLLVTDAATSPYLWTTDIADFSASPGLRTEVRTDDSGGSRIAVTPKATPTAYRCVASAH